MKFTILAFILLTITACSSTPKQAIVYQDSLAERVKQEKMERCQLEAGMILFVNKELISEQQAERMYKLLLDSCVVHYKLAI